MNRHQIKHFFLLFLFFPLLVNAQSMKLAFKNEGDLLKEYLNKEGEIYSQEIKITNQKLARKLFRWLPGKPHEVNGVYGTWYKHHEYMLCVRNNEAITSCSIYFSSKADGSLASFHKDYDYGMGDIVDATFDKAIEFKTDLFLYEDKIQIRFNQPDVVKKVFKKIDLAEQKDQTGVNYESESYFGKHVACTSYESKDQNNGKYAECLISIPIRREKPSKPVLPNT